MHRHKHAQTTSFFIYMSQQSTFRPNIRTGKISLEIDMKAISKPKKKLHPLLRVMFFLQLQVLDFIVDFED